MPNGKIAIVDSKSVHKRVNHLNKSSQSMEGIGTELVLESLLEDKALPNNVTKDGDNQAKPAIRRVKLRHPDDPEINEMGLGGDMNHNVNALERHNFSNKKQGHELYEIVNKQNKKYTLEIHNDLIKYLYKLCRYRISLAKKEKAKGKTIRLKVLQNDILEVPYHCMTSSMQIIYLICVYCMT